ncbi:MAG: hypothetical protein LBC18_03930, partial [Opitutaceae bacterium]|nr:hypothetical protein [Opitutaceae bacterium]
SSPSSTPTPPPAATPKNSSPKNANKTMSRFLAILSGRFVYFTDVTRKRRQCLIFSAPEERGVSAPKGRQAPVSADFAPKGRQHLAVGDGRSEEPTESIKKKTSPEGAAAREGRGNAMTRTARAAAPSGLTTAAPRLHGLST